jgi:hypothetical protein
VKMNRITATFKNLSHDEPIYSEQTKGPALSRITLRREFDGTMSFEHTIEVSYELG